MTGLASKTHKVFDDVSTLSCIREYTLVGGTALALQINHRLSEDLDFCKWVDTSSARHGIALKEIEQELKSTFAKVDMNPIDFDQVDYLLNGEVKLQYFNEVGYTLPDVLLVSLQHNLVLASVPLIGAMKIKTMFQRTAFRDYYDVYAIVKEGHVTLAQLIELAKTYNSSNSLK